MSQSLEGLLIGRTLAGRYLIEEVIGRGGMSVVYRARDERLGRPVAVKIVSLPAEGAERSDLRARLRREAASAARIPAHPNVVHVYDYGTDPELDLDFIVMELLTGRDLKSAMASRPLRGPEPLRVLREAARGIAAGHRAGIVHRDVKPGNIFLVGGERLEMVKILDFGIAKALAMEGEDEDDLTRTGIVPHSPAYASPEQLDPERPVTAASDVYQLGLVGYELLAGERPFGEPERARIRAGEDVPLPAYGDWAGVPDDLRETISRALRPRPEDRYANAAELAEALGVLTDPTQREAAGPPAEDDATLAMAVAPPPASASLGEHSALADEAIPELEGAHTARSDTAAEGLGGLLPRRLPGRGVQLAGGALLALLGLWAISRLGGDAPAPDTEAAALDTRALDEEFRPLIASAAAAEGADRPADDADAAAEVERVIIDMNDAWVRGDLDRHVAHYADRVRFYGARRATRGDIAEERGEALERYDSRQITIDRTAIRFPEPGRAIALVDKTWRFTGDDDARFEGSARQELILELRQGVWQVVSEQDREVYRSDREG